MIRWTRFGLALALLALLAQASWAVPAFARRHNVSCTTCHAPFPKLSEYGEEFAGNGFIMKEEERERDYVTAGDDLLWLNKELPLAVRFDAFGVFNEGAQVDSDLQTPWGVKLLSGGTLTRNVGYYFYFYMAERGEVAGVEDAYIHFDDVRGWPLDIMVGQFQTSDPLMKRELRLSFEDYHIYTTRVGDSGTNLAYDRGVMFVTGLEKTGTDIVAFVVNGNGRAEAGADRAFDSDGRKNVGLRLAQGIGEHLSIGGYAYLGSERPAGGAFDNDIQYLGPDLNLQWGTVEFTGQLLLRTDSDPTFSGGDEVETTGMVAELVVAPRKEKSRLLFTALYNRVDSDLDAHDLETATLSATWLLSRNLRLLAEGTQDLEAERSRFVVGLVSAF